MRVAEFQSVFEATSFVGRTIQEALHKDIEEKGGASLILTGGQTVRPFLEELTKLDIPWDKVWIVLSDERWVPVTDEQSNEKQLRELFLSYLKVQPRYISLKTDHASPAEACSYLEDKIFQVPHPFSCAILSVGEDGHVASLFPGEMPQWCSQMHPVFYSRLRGDRLSLCFSILNKIEKTLLLSKKTRDFNQNHISYIQSIFGNETYVCRF